MFKPEMLITGNATASLPPSGSAPIVVPKSAVMWTGKRSVVYVKGDSADMPAFVLVSVARGHHARWLRGGADGWPRARGFVTTVPSPSMPEHSWGRKRSIDV
jgi:hypothetical protein